MQTLWSRIVQTKRACKCSSCFSSAAACTRRTATAVFRTRISSRDRFTVLCSSFLTAATVIDSEIKGRKREKLLGAIKEARDELKALNTSQNCRLAALSTDYDDIKDLALSGQRTWEDVLRWAEQEERARHVLGLEGWKGIPLSILERLSTIQLEDAFCNNSVLRKRLFGADSRAVTTPVSSVKKQKIIEWSSAKLAYRFLMEIYQHSIPLDDVFTELGNVSGGPNKMKLPFSGDAVHADEMIARLRKLPPHSADVEQTLSPEAPRYILNPQLNGRKVAMLNSSLDEVFRICRTQGKGLQSLITNVCHHLLTSNAPPTIETYTLLARNFDELGEHGLVKLVRDAIYECKFRFDEEALTFWLDYYAKTNNIEEFQKLVSRLHGFFGNDLVPAHVNNIASGIAFDQYQFGNCEIGPPQNPSTCEDSTASDNEYFALKYRDLDFMVFRAARKDQGVYCSLIKGTLKFDDNKKAMGSYVDLIREGHEPTVEILTTILHQCCENKDWRSGLMVLQKIRTIGGANLQTYRWLLRLCQKCQDGQRFKKSLADGIRCGVISPAVEYFPEQIEAMEADLLLDLARGYDELVQRVEEKRTSSEPPERLARWLGVIGLQMAETAFEFGFLTLSDGLSPSKGYFLYTRIEYHRADLLGWTERRENRISKDIHDVLDISPGTSSALADAPSGTGEVSRKVEVPKYLDTNPSSTKYTPIRPRGKHASPWDPLLRMLVSDFLKMASLLSNLARGLGDIELSIRHGPTIGHMLRAKMVLFQRRALNSVKSSKRRPSSLLVHDWKKEDQSAPHTPQDPKISTSRPKELPYQGKLLNSERRLQEWERHRELDSEMAGSPGLWEGSEQRSSSKKGSFTNEKQFAQRSSSKKDSSRNETQFAQKRKGSFRNERQWPKTVEIEILMGI